MIKLYSPDNEIDLILIRSLLEGAGIPYFVHNDHFGTLRTGPRIDLLNRKTVMVPAQFEERAKDLLTDFAERKKTDDEPSEPNYSGIDKVRMAIETLLFGWFVPGNRWQRRRKTGGKG